MEIKIINPWRSGFRIIIPKIKVGKSDPLLWKSLKTIQKEALVCGLHVHVGTPYNVWASVWEKCD